VLLVLTLQHSHELGRLEEKTRTLAEEVALLRLDLRRRDRAEGPDSTRGTDAGDAGEAGDADG